MRIVAVADTHLFTDDLVVPDGDVFVHAGDLCRGGDLGELKTVIAWLASLPHRHKVIIAGNHDWALAPCAHEPVICHACLMRGHAQARVSCMDDAAAAHALFAGMTYLEDSETTLDGVRFYGSPWQPAFHDWAFNLARGEAIAAKWAAIPHDLDVLITHGPPEGIGDRTEVAGRTGCADLRRRVAEVVPRLHLFGHIHQDGGVWTAGPTMFANVTTWECERPPTVIDLDPATRAVTPVVVPPRDPRA